MNWSRALIIVVLTASAPAVPSAQEAEPLPKPSRVELERQIDRFLEPLLEQDQVSGRLFVRRGDGPPIVRDMGWADRELQVPIDASSRFNIASVTKPMTLIALYALMDGEVLAGTDPIAKWLPDFPRAADITVAMLVNHQAGVPHRLMDEADETVPRTAADMTELAAARGLDFEPGADESYSSGGFSVLARVMELAAGKPYQQLLDESVFSPSGMTGSRHVDARELLPGRVSSYVTSMSGGPVNAPLKDLSFLVGAGSVWSTADDLDRMVQALRAGRLGQRAADELLRESGFRSNGRTSGFRTFVDWHRELDLTVIFTGNRVTGAADLIRGAIPRLAAGDVVDSPDLPKLTAVPQSREVLVGFEGSYQLRPGRLLEVTAIDGGLQIGSWILIPIGERLFVSPQDYATIEFVLADDGRPERMDWTVGGQTFELPRVGSDGVPVEGSDQ